MDASSWNRRYAEAAREGRLWSAQPARVVQTLLAAVPPGSALDVACGDGRNTAWLVERGWQVTALDFSVEALKLAERHTPAGPGTVRWVHADVRHWQADEPFDLVLVSYLHLPSAENLAMLRRAAGWVAPGGHLLVVGHDVENLATGAHGPRDPDVLYTPSLLEDGAVGLRVERLERARRPSGADPETTDEQPDIAVDAVLWATAPER